MGHCGRDGTCSCISPFTRSGADGKCWDERPLLAQKLAMQDLKRHMAEPSALRDVVKKDWKLDAKMRQHDALRKDQASLYAAFKSLETLQAKTKTDEHPRACKHAMLAWVKLHLQKEAT